jgi:conjugative relaxase-like TrwC/TraI family protein
VEAALDYMQEAACWTRRGAGGREFVGGNGFLAAYTHRSSRAGDPQLHTHVLIANATKGSDGRWTRLYHPAIYEHAEAAGYIYEAHLRDELARRLGVRWGEVRNGIAATATRAMRRGFSRSARGGRSVRPFATRAKRNRGAAKRWPP